MQGEVPGRKRLETLDDADHFLRHGSTCVIERQQQRGGRYTSDYGYSDVVALAQASPGEDQFGYRNEFVRLVRLAESLMALED